MGMSVKLRLINHLVWALSNYYTDHRPYFQDSKYPLVRRVVSIMVDSHVGKSAREVADDCLYELEMI
jgi:hypothetical protein